MATLHGFQCHGAAFALAALLSPLAAGQNNLQEEIFDSAGGYTAFWMHDSLTFVDSHLVDHEEEWKIWGGHFCFGEMVIDDKLVNTISRQHLVAPHTEGPTGILTFVNIIIPDEYPEDPRLIRMVSENVVVSHESHSDIHSTLGYVRLAYFLGKADISAWNLMQFGVHTDNPNSSVTIDSESLRENVLGISDEDSVGSLVGYTDPGTGMTRCMLAINGLAGSDLFRASLNLGGPQETGPAIVDLGGPADWTELPGIGLKRVATFQVPQQHTAAFLNGQVYVNIATNEFPLCATRGQVNRTYTGVQPVQFQVLRGLVTAGSLAETIHSDEERLTVQKFFVVNAQEEPIQVAFTGSSYVLQPSAMRVSVEASASGPGIRQTISARNHQNGQLEIVDQRLLRTTDGHTQLDVPNPERFVATDGRVELLVSFKPTGPTAQSAWSVRMDQIHWQTRR